ncbi:MAG: HAD family phosphatase [Saprospiraceae bacterium]|nr:HAD family phosphatase [Saprospiraceae bacterium]
MEGFIFDMDGTMVDNMMVHHRAWQKKLATLGIEMSMAEVKEHIHGVNEEILERLFGERFTLAERKQVAYEKEAEYRVIFKDQLSLIPGLHQFLSEAFQKGIPMAIGTAAPPENVDFVLDRLNLRHYFGGVIHARNVSRGKPDPETFVLAAQSIGIPTERCLVFEDSLAGAHTAKNAGCPAIIVTSTHQQQEFEHFDHILKFINDFSEINLEEVLSLNLSI